MIKFLMILLGIFLVIFLAIGWIIKKVKSLFMPFQQQSTGSSHQSASQQKQHTEPSVIYKKDDVVVMKGDAGKKNK